MKLINYLFLFSQLILAKKMNNSLMHTKQIAFHAPKTNGVYAVAFDVFMFIRPRRGF